MSASTGEPTITDRLEDRPSLSVRRLREVSPRELAIRFGTGALTSIAAGIVTLAFGARVGGVFLAVPAILAASLTLSEEQEDSVDAREDARGAIAGACGMAVFALVGALEFGVLPGGVVLAIAAGAWMLVSAALYALLWWR